jgi:hypothetical protein
MRVSALSLLSALVVVALVAGCATSTGSPGSVLGISPSQLNGRYIQSLTLNTTLPAAGVSLLAADLSMPTGIEEPLMYLGVLFECNVGGVLSVSHNVGSGNSTMLEQLNGGVALVPNQTYAFVVPIVQTEVMNFRYSANGTTTNGTIQRLAVMDLYEGGYAGIQIINGTLKYTSGT